MKVLFYTSPTFNINRGSQFPMKFGNTNVIFVPRPFQSHTIKHHATISLP